MTYHDYRDWTVRSREKSTGRRLGGEEWTQGLPPGLPVEDVVQMFEAVWRRHRARHWSYPSSRPFILAKQSKMPINAMWVMMMTAPQKASIWVAIKYSCCVLGLLLMQGSTLPEPPDFPQYRSLYVLQWL